MAYNRFEIGIFLRVAGLAATLALLTWMIVHTDWYVTMALVTMAILAQAVLLGHFAAHSGREVARFLLRVRSRQQIIQNHCGRVRMVPRVLLATRRFRCLRLPGRGHTLRLTHGNDFTPPWRRSSASRTRSTNMQPAYGGGIQSCAARISP